MKMFPSDDESFDESFENSDYSDTENTTKEDLRIGSQSKDCERKSSDEEFDRRIHSDEDDRDSVGGHSTSSSSVSRSKKRVTFPTEENLVFIREIPPRDFYSDTDTPVDSCESDETSESSESEDLEEEVSEKLNICTEKPPITISCVSKGRYEVGKSTGKTSSKVAQITGAILNDKNDSNKKTTLKKRRIKSAPPTLDGNKTQQDKQKSVKALKPRAKSATTKSTTDNKTKTIAKKPKVKSTKENKKCATTSKTKTERSSPKNSASTKSDPVVNGVCGIIEADTSVIKGSKDIQIMQTQCLRTANENLWKLFDNRDHDTVSCNGKVKGIYPIDDKSLEDKRMKSKISNDQNRQRPDVRTMSTTDRRLYSWLVANGNVPNPQYETPSISPLWECTPTESKTVKAHI